MHGGGSRRVALRGSQPGAISTVRAEQGKLPSIEVERLPGGKGEWNTGYHGAEESGSGRGQGSFET